MCVLGQHNTVSLEENILVVSCEDGICAHFFIVKSMINICEVL